MKKSISVFGAGSWGTALAKLLAEKKEHQVKLWVRNAEQAKEIGDTRQNSLYLPGTLLPEELAITSDITSALPADLLVFAVPSHALRATIRQLSGFITPGQLMLSCAKGLEDGTFLRMSQILLQEYPHALSATLSGPNHAREVADRQPTATVIATEDEKAAERIQEIFNCAYFRPYTNKDIIGVELAGAFKNIIAIALGLLNGLGYQDNIKAATMTRGLAEISRLGVALGASPATFLGLAGMGDLISTCTSKHSRNRWAGEQLAKGRSVKDVLSSTNMVVEGIMAIDAAYLLSVQENIPMPITGELYKVIHENKNIDKAVQDLMNRAYKAEE